MRKGNNGENRADHRGEYPNPKSRLIPKWELGRAGSSRRAVLRLGVDYLSKIHSPPKSDGEERPTRDGPCDRAHRTPIVVQDYYALRDGFAKVGRERAWGE